MSEILLAGFADENGDVVLAGVGRSVPMGANSFKYDDFY